jgi:hypothetical protein
MMERRANGLAANPAMGDPRRDNGDTGPERSGAPILPVRWHGILTAEQWQRAVEAIGEPRLDELHSMLAEVSPRFRASFVGHLARIAPGERANAAVLLALAHAAHDARPEREA